MISSDNKYNTDLHQMQDIIMVIGCGIIVELSNFQMINIRYKIKNIFPSILDIYNINIDQASPFNSQIIQLEFLPPQSCVSLTQSKTSSE